MPQSNYPIYPSPTTGSGTPYGKVPGPISMPNPYADLAGAFPQLTQANKLAGTDILAELGGNITPGTRNALQLAAAQAGAGRGMPLAGLSTNDLLGNIVGFSEGQVKQGMADYNSLIPTISKTQTVDPALQTDIAARNALYAAAPDPQQANNLAQKLFDQYLNNLRGPGGGTTPTSYTPRGPSGGTAGPSFPDTRTTGPAWTGNVFTVPGGNTDNRTTGGGNFFTGDFVGDWTSSDPWGTGGFPWGGPNVVSSEYNPLADPTYGAPTLGGIGSTTPGANALLPDYTNPFGIGNVGEGGGGGSVPTAAPYNPLEDTSYGGTNAAWNDVLSMF